MTITVTVERPARLGGSRVRALLRTARRKLSAVAEAAVAPHKTALSNLTRMPLTIAAVGCADSAFFTWHLFAGLIATAISLLWLETRIADE